MASPLLVLEGHAVKYRVTFEGLAVPGERSATPFDADVLEAQLDRVMEQLVQRRAGDATVSGTMAKGEVEVSLLVEAPDLESALERGQAIVRAALNEAARTGTAWAFDWTSIKAMRIESLAQATG
jgi:hypothetical protein